MIEYTKRNIRAWSIMGINPSIWSVGFNEIAQNKEKVTVITADLQRYSGLERTFSNYPDICFNVGIAEQNMVGIAAGMAMDGVQTYMTTYAPFMSYRCADHARHFMGNLHLDMKAIGSAAGLSAGLSGLSLLAINDIAFFRSIPGVIVLNPADCTEAVKLMVAMSEIKDPVYMRFCGTTKIPIVYEDDYDLEIGKAVYLARGSSIAIIATGTTLVSEAVKAAKVIKEENGLELTVINMHTLSPIDTVVLDEISQNHDHIITIEEHSKVGGLGSAVAEYITSQNYDIQLHMLGVDSLTIPLGGREFMLENLGLTAVGLENCCKHIIGG